MKFLERLQRHHAMQPLNQGGDLVPLQMQGRRDPSAGPTEGRSQPAGWVGSVPTGWCVPASGSQDL